jgi:quercetin dioxygenase-like cupin family protein
MTTRRIVTGYAATGKAVVWKDGPPTNQVRAVPGFVSSIMWITDQTPCEYAGAEDMGLRKIGIAPPPGGTRFAVLEIGPEAPVFWHRTDSVDYVICIEGEVDLELDGGESVKMRAGDVMIQRGANHAWVNRSGAPARIAVVLIDAKPKREGSLTSHPASR